MRRLEFIVARGGAALWPLAVLLQPVNVAWLGYIAPTRDVPWNEVAYQSFVDELPRLGFSDASQYRRCSGTEASRHSIGGGGGKLTAQLATGRETS
jgi:hypothetical protein